VPDTGHFIMLEQPHLIANWVKDIAQVEHDDHVENQTK
jgi:pimeloyl-ACP methyl ester carboxylesterase